MHASSPIPRVRIETWQLGAQWRVRNGLFKLQPSNWTARTWRKMAGGETVSSTAIQRVSKAPRRPRDTETRVAHAIEGSRGISRGRGTHARATRSRARPIGVYAALLSASVWGTGNEPSQWRLWTGQGDGAGIALQARAGVLARGGNNGTGARDGKIERLPTKRRPCRRMQAHHTTERRIVCTRVRGKCAVLDAARQDVRNTRGDALCNTLEGAPERDATAACRAWCSPTRMRVRARQDMSE